jgi:uncharacterized membrane protein
VKDGDPAAPKSALHNVEDYVVALLDRRAARDVSVLQDQAPRTAGQRAADRFTRAAGSWAFIITFLLFLAVWMAVNAVAAIRHWDPYPFILLNLVLSCVAALQAPIILMSQNREEARDRLRAQADYDVNLKAEVLLEHLTEEIELLKAMLADVQGGFAAQENAGERSDG